MKLGVCYYPEHWPREVWAGDARAMAAMGLSWVRIGEFAWSRMEPEPGRFDWAWLDEAVNTLHAAGLKIVMGTPTATPPKWLVDADPSMLAVDRHGRPRKFGSRRHYCFSSASYRRQCARIVEALAERYGRHPGVGAWQTDNEFGCHDTTLSYSQNAAAGFRLWLTARYGDIAALNAAWGAVFWSQEYRGFDEIDPPSGAVTEASPSHRLDYARFASDEVARFHKVQADIIRRLSPGRDVIHNFMGFYTDFDHFAVGRDLDVAAWDSYPLGFTEMSWLGAEEKRRYLRQGHPDIAAFHHDLYRGCGRGRMWVMEQQPGPVNWATYNPAPLPGMVRAWTWQAFAHGAEVVSYFRWRQAPFGQEQMHAGLNRPDFTRDEGGIEARQVADELAAVGRAPPRGLAPVALVFSYEADWLLRIQPQGRGFRWLELAFEMYSAIRRLGLDVDIVDVGADLTGYRAVVIPSLPIVDEAFAKALGALRVPLLLGPRTGSKTRDLHIPANLPPGPLAAFLPVRIDRVESLRPDLDEAVTVGDQRFPIRLWRETMETDLAPLARFGNGAAAWVRAGSIDYLACWPGADLLDRVVGELCARAGLDVRPMPEGVRISRLGDLVIAINSSPEARVVPAPKDAAMVLGSLNLAPAGVAVWREAGGAAKAP
ncbi:MAG: beta-galactosidase [Caulobacteraceae bacterium]